MRRSPRIGFHDGNGWWRNRESNPGRRSCKDQLQPAAFPVPGRGFEPRSPRFRRGAFTRLAYQAHLVRVPVIETGPGEWRSPARPSSYTRDCWNWRELDEANLVPRSDHACSADTAPAPSLLALPPAFAIWRKREVLIPNGWAIHLASNERRTLVRLRFPSGGRLSARCPYAVAYHSLSRRCRSLTG